MKLKFIIRDIDYMRALADSLSKADINLYAEIGKDFNSDPETLIVTDYDAGRLQNETRRRSLAGIVFLSPVSGIAGLCDDEPWIIYKYKRVSEILADLKYYYYLWTGKGVEKINDAGMISVQSDCGAETTAYFSKLLAQQFIYRIGGEVLIIPLSYVSRSTPAYDEKNDSFTRLMYYIYADKSFPSEVFYIRDRIGVSYVRTAQGINPIAGLDEDGLKRLIEHSVSNTFDLVILDVGSELSKKNKTISESCANKFWLYEGEYENRRNSSIMREYFSDISSVNEINLGIDREKLSLTADDYIRKMFASEEVNEEVGD